eukprot:GILJ01000989.1.p1 GENE.GILJ01000989.1~~GILJ01000989.1.p1  ORF type:complete len:555 (-),score=79.43 GILJ01000989.1:186-1850(-)
MASSTSRLLLFAAICGSLLILTSATELTIQMHFVATKDGSNWEEGNMVVDVPAQSGSTITFGSITKSIDDIANLEYPITIRLPDPTSLSIPNMKCGRVEFRNVADLNTKIWSWEQILFCFDSLPPSRQHYDMEFRAFATTLRGLIHDPHSAIIAAAPVGFPTSAEFVGLFAAKAALNPTVMVESGQFGYTKKSDHSTFSLRRLFKTDRYDFTCEGYRVIRSYQAKLPGLAKISELVITVVQTEASNDIFMGFSQTATLLDSIADLNFLGPSFAAQYKYNTGSKLMKYASKGARVLGKSVFHDQVYVDFAQYVLSQVVKEFSPTKIWLSGFSLGGFMAELTYLMFANKYPTVNFQVFTIDAPGARSTYNRKWAKYQGILSHIFVHPTVKSINGINKRLKAKREYVHAAPLVVPNDIHMKNYYDVVGYWGEHTGHECVIVPDLQAMHATFGGAISLDEYQQCQGNEHYQAHASFGLPFNTCFAAFHVKFKHWDLVREIVKAINNEANTLPGAWNDVVCCLPNAQTCGTVVLHQANAQTSTLDETDEIEEVEDDEEM